MRLLPGAETPAASVAAALADTAGGRVLCATALGENISDARNRAYVLAEKIHWDGVYYRRDIGHRALAREAQ